MTLRFLFDECVSLPSFDQLCEHLKGSTPAVELAHVIQWDLAGKRDEEWVPAIADQGWIVISADRGRGGLGRGQKLPHLCLVNRVTLIALSKAIHHQKSAEKLQSILAAWPQILKASHAARGTRFTLRYGRNNKLLLKRFKSKS